MINFLSILLLLLKLTMASAGIYLVGHLFLYEELPQHYVKIGALICLLLIITGIFEGEE
ncbi:MAG: hypothetical protein Kow0083_05920 [Methylophaga sp.]